MPSFPNRLLHRVVAILLLVTGVATPIRAQESTSEHVAQLKRMQVRFMMRGAQREVDRALARQRAKKKPAAWRPGTSGQGLRRRPAPTGEPPDPPIAGPGARVPTPARVAAIADDQVVNDRTTDTATCPSVPCTGLPWSGQCEVTIAARGNTLVAAWNDGEGFETGGSTQGFGYSNDCGATWIDGGVPPVSGGIGSWSSDPVVAVNEKTGAFYFAALCEPTAASNGIAVVKGTFSGGVLTWGTPKLVVSGLYRDVVYDKEWLAADSTTGNLYVIYSRFSVSNGNITSNRIDFQRNTADNGPVAPWGNPITLSSSADAGRVQGARVAVGPNGEVWTVWNAIGGTELDYMRVRRSTNAGTSFQTEITAASLYTNFGSGAPGFNRGLGFAFPSIAVDRGPGSTRGRVHLAWNESLNFYDDLFGGTDNANSVSETESNDTPATADPFTMGRTLRGSIGSITDFDYWSFSGTQGQTIICEMDSTAAPLDASFRLFCTDGSTRLAFSETGLGSSGLIVFTLPATGTYYLRVASLPPDPVTPAGTGPYRIRTVLNGLIPERGRDHRDVFTSYSDNYSVWSTPVRVNQDPAYYDNWLPEVAVAANDTVYALWYDWRDSGAGLCGGASMTYLARSNDFAASWPNGSPVSAAPTTWTTAYSNITPNQGDYTALFANQNAVYACWSDGRNGDPDVFMATVDARVAAPQVGLQSVSAAPGLVRLVWSTPDVGLTATVYRSTDMVNWTALGDVSRDSEGRLVFEDHGAVAGTRYYYRLGLHGCSGETLTQEVAVDVPTSVATEPSIHEVRPIPADLQVFVTFTLPGAGPATLELLDVSGRRVRERSVSGLGEQTIDLGTGEPLRAGVYLVRLTQGGKSAVSRVSVLR
jgi:pre-peptidase